MTICNKCKKESEVRFGVCFDCASSGEERSAKRTVLQHLCTAAINIKARKFEYAKYDLSWAWQRLTHTGDYEKGGTFDFEGYDWR